MSNRFRFEAETRLIRWGESSSAGRTITLELPPDDGASHPFRGFPTGHTGGQRFRMQFDAIADDEQIAPQDSPAGAPSTSPQSANRKDITAAGEPDGKRSPKPALAGGYHKTPAERAVIRAAILCSEPSFRIWMAGEDISSAAAAAMLREACGVSSRADIAKDPDALDRFIKLETEYKIATGAFAERR